MKGIKIIETDLDGAISAARAGKLVFLDKEAKNPIDSWTFTEIICRKDRKFYYKTLVDIVKSDTEDINTCGRPAVTCYLPREIPVGTRCHVIIEILTEG